MIKTTQILEQYRNVLETTGNPDKLLTKKLIKEFLKLPKEAMPNVFCEDDEETNPWKCLRDWLKPESKQEINHIGDLFILRADHEGWNKGVAVVLN